MAVGVTEVTEHPNNQSMQANTQGQLTWGNNAGDGLIRSKYYQNKLPLFKLFIL